MQRASAAKIPGQAGAGGRVYCRDRGPGLKFSEEVAWQLERLYLTKDVVAQRSETIKQLALSEGERVLEIGSGPGFLCESIADIFGRNGTIVGVDISSDLVARCRQRNPPEWLSYEVGDATRLAPPDASFDVVVCTQVAEYIPDVSRALSEILRVVKRGGRALFLAADWDGIVGTRKRQTAWYRF